MLQNRLVTVQRLIQEPCQIEERSLRESSKLKTKKRSLLPQTLCGTVSVFYFLFLEDVQVHCHKSQGILEARCLCLYMKLSNHNF